MTAIVGILCQNGVVLGTDSSATFSTGRMHTVEQPTQKLRIIEDSIILAGTGQVGLGQRFQSIIEKSWQDGIFKKKTALEITRYLSRVTLQDFDYTFAPKQQYGALLAFPAERRLHLCEFAVTDFQPELKTDVWYASLGATQYITDSFLALMREVFWKAGPPHLSGGEFVATWTLEHAIDVNVGGVKGPIQLAVLGLDSKGKLRAKQLSEIDLGEHKQNIDRAKKALLDYCLSLQKPKDEEARDIPRPISK